MNKIVLSSFVFVLLSNIHSFGQDRALCNAIQAALDFRQMNKHFHLKEKDTLFTVHSENLLCNNGKFSADGEKVNYKFTGVDSVEKFQNAFLQTKNLDSLNKAKYYLFISQIDVKQKGNLVTVFFSYGLGNVKGFITLRRFKKSYKVVTYEVGER